MDPISWLLINLYGLLAGGIQLFIPFLLATLVLTLVFNFVKKKTGWKWVGSASFTLIASFTLFFFLLNVYFILGGSAQTDVTQVPEDIRASPMWVQSQSNVFFLIIRAIPQSVFAGIVFGLLLLPFAFIGTAVFDSFKKRFKGFWVRFGITVFLGCILFILLLGLFPWIPVSLLYLVFYGF